MGLSIADLPLGDNHEWARLAACKDAPKSVFFPAGAGSRSAPARRAFLLYCGRCPVWDDCFDASFSLVEPFVGEEEGIWAGLTKSDRERFRNEPRKAKAKAMGIETR